MRFEEMRKISVIVQVLDEHFRDDKEVAELFKYVFEKSKLYKSMHPPMTLRYDYTNDGKKVWTFSLMIRADDDAYEVRKTELELLIDAYDITEREYIRFKTFKSIESHAMDRIPLNTKGVTE